MATYEDVAGSEMERPATMKTSYTVNYARTNGVGVSFKVRRVEYEVVVLSVEMHCKCCCALRISDSVRSFKGVKQVEVEFDTGRVTVKGKNVDPEKLVRFLHEKMEKKINVVACYNESNDKRKSKDTSKSSDKKRVNPDDIEKKTEKKMDLVTCDKKSNDESKDTIKSSGKKQVNLDDKERKTEKKMGLVTCDKKSNDKSKGTSKSSEKKQVNPNDKGKKQIVVSPRSIDDDHNKNNKDEKHKDNERIVVSPQSIDDDHNKNNKDEKHKDKESIKKPPEKTAMIKGVCWCEHHVNEIKTIISKTKGIQVENVDKEKQIVTITGMMDAMALEETLKKKLKSKAVKVEELGESSKNA